MRTRRLVAESNTTASVCGKGKKRGTREGIVEAAQPEQIILSGSAAGGQMRAENDFEFSSSSVQSTTGRPADDRHEPVNRDSGRRGRRRDERGDRAYRGTLSDVSKRRCTKAACCMAASARGTDPATAENQ